MRWCLCCVWCVCLTVFVSPLAATDRWRDLQTEAITNCTAAFGHWGPDPSKYSGSTSHSNRLIPVVTFGMDLTSVSGQRSAYRDAERIKALYGRLPENTLNESAMYFDQTDVYRLQKMAADAGKKHIVLIVFDGMDWQLAQLGAIAKSKAFVNKGRGHGLSFLDYHHTSMGYGYIATSPFNDGMDVDVNTQQVVGPGDALAGGYDFNLAGQTPWATPADPLYLIAKSKTNRQAYTDSSASATSMTAGIKTYNESVNVDPFGRQVETIAHQLQARGYAIGAVSSVPIVHATPACTYAHNVDRDDYQDLTRDLVGLPSISHPETPLAGMDVIIGAGWGDDLETDQAQGANFVPGNRYLTEADLKKIDSHSGGAYVTVMRQPNTNGREQLGAAAEQAIATKHRLLGMFGNPTTGHLPFRTADGDYNPTVGIDGDGNVVAAEEYTSADLTENPTLAEMTSAALDVLSSRSDHFWLMVESGDVDWAAHRNNVDDAAGAVISGDEAFEVVVRWIESRNAWDDSVVIVTSDHGHYFVFDDPQVLVEATNCGSRE